MQSPPAEDGPEASEEATAALNLMKFTETQAMFQNDYSWTDKVASFWSTLLLASLAFTSLLLRYVTSPITCYGPVYMTATQTYYYHQKCLQEEKYKRFSIYEDESTTSSYHLWVPLALTVSALLCLLPHAMWSLFSRFLWVDAHLLLQNLRDTQGLPHEDRHPLLRETASLLVTALKRGNSALALASVGRKSLLMVTCLVQAVLVTILFEPQLRFQPWGAGSEVNTSAAALPREDFVCTFAVYQMSTIQQFSVQCFLPINEVYSKGFTFLFYMFLLLTIVTGLDLLMWVARVAVPGISDYPVRRYLEAALGAEREDCATPEKMYPRFSQLMGWDGRLVLALTADYCGPLTAVALVKNLAGDWLTASIVSRSLAQSFEPHVERQSGVIPLVPMDDLNMGYERLSEK